MAHSTRVNLLFITVKTSSFTCDVVIPTLNLSIQTIGFHFSFSMHVEQNGEQVPQFYIFLGPHNNMKIT